MIEQLKTFTDYSIVVQAFNEMGAGPKSRELIVTTMEDGIIALCSIYLKRLW